MKKLSSKRFEFCRDLVDFVNQNHIKQEDIQAIVAENCKYPNANDYTLFYWIELGVFSNTTI